VPARTPGAVAVPGKRILLAAPRGYCAGVDRAVDAVEKALAHYGPPVYVRKEIVHNRFVVDTLSQRGAIFVDETDEVPEGARVVFSALRGLPRGARAGGGPELATIDATARCHQSKECRCTRSGASTRDIRLIGHDGHEEVEGTWAEASRAHPGGQLVRTRWTRWWCAIRRVVWLSQTICP
jgi:4-hydroxy-3-methylbut-2-enyl diphosphate reductase